MSETNQIKFEKKWQQRFESFAKGTTEAKISGWSENGLRTRFTAFKRLWSYNPEQKNWLDLGCGAGTYSQFLLEKQLEVVSLDYSQPTLDKAKQIIPTADFALGNAMALPFVQEKFDGVLCFGVLQALTNPYHAINEINFVLKPGGQVWLEGLNLWCLPNFYKAFKRKLQSKPKHLNYLSPFAIKKYMASLGFVNIKVVLVPIAPGKLQFLQPLLESKLMLFLIKVLKPIFMLTSHAYIIKAEKA